MYPVVIGIKRMIAGGDSQNEWNVVMATAMLAMLPPALVVVLMQKWFVKGLVDTENKKYRLAQAHQNGFLILKQTSSSATAAARRISQVIHGVNADIADGEFVVIVGPSGCGKSTLLRMVAGLEEITGGEISIGGRVVNDLEPSERDIAMVFQNYALYPHMSVFDNMAYGLKIAKVPKAEIKTPGRQGRQNSGDWPLPAAQAAPALRRPAPARRHGPRHRAPAAGVPVRRTAVQPGRQAARPDPA